MKTGTEKEVLHIEDLSYAYEKNVPVLKGISMDANHGESIGLIGANGVGKSTFLKLLVGLNQGHYISIDWMDTKEIPLKEERCFRVR